MTTVKLHIDSYDRNQLHGTIESLFDMICEDYSTLNDHGHGTFMVPQMHDGDQYGHDELVEMGVIEQDEELDYEEFYLVRLSAPGYLDCTDWTIVYSMLDLLEWADTMIYD